MNSKTFREPIYKHWNKTRIDYEIEETEKNLIRLCVEDYVLSHNIKESTNLKVGIEYPKIVSYNDVPIGKIQTLVQDDHYTVCYIKLI